MDNPNNQDNDFPLTDAVDQAILMHRDAHFSGNFDIMLDYYKNPNKGVCEDFEIDRIIALYETEREMGTNLSALLLSGSDAEKIAKSKEIYKKLRDLYEHSNKTHPNKDRKDKKHALLIADLILSEDEEPLEEIEAIVNEKGAIVKPLIDLLKAEDFYDPLMPGYGKAPLLAAKCLGLIGDKRAITSLFEALGEGDFFDENIELEALKAIGEPAKEFLLNVVKSRPLNVDNERAAVALIQFKEDLEVATNCFKLLLEEDVLKNQILATYLVMACEHLNQTSYKDDFIALADNQSLDKMIRLDIKSLTKEW